MTIPSVRSLPIALLISLLLLVVGLMAPARSHAAVTTTDQGWGYVASASGQSAVYAWQWSGAKWVQSYRVNRQQVYVWPFTTGWTWTWTEDVGWLAVQSADLSMTLTSASRTYPLHTNINSTTYWVGEQFQATSDGSQVCSAYDTQWQYSYFRLKSGTNNTVGCKGAPTGGCDAKVKVAGGKCDEENSVGSLRTPANGYFPAGLAPIYESPFYLDLPYDDYNRSDATDRTGFSRRCTDIPWANDSGYAGHCNDTSFSYMKNRFVKIMANGRTCYGQIEDAGPADDGNGNGNYSDYPYVFGANDARPHNTSYNSAGMDVSPALGACLGGVFNEDLTVSWQFVDDAAVPAGPWKTIVTRTPPN